MRTWASVPSACVTWREMSGSGAPTGMHPIITRDPTRAAPTRATDSRPEFDLSAAEAGSARHFFAAVHTGAGARRLRAGGAWAFDASGLRRMENTSVPWRYRKIVVPSYRLKPTSVKMFSLWPLAIFWHL